MVLGIAKLTAIGLGNPAPTKVSCEISSRSVHIFLDWTINIRLQKIVFFSKPIQTNNSPTLRLILMAALMMSSMSSSDPINTFWLKASPDWQIFSVSGQWTSE